MTPAQVKPPISPELLDQIDVRVGTILSVCDVASSEKLVALEVNLGDHKRTVLAGMKRERANPREIDFAVPSFPTCASVIGGASSVSRPSVEFIRTTDSWSR